jgi:beta-1,4-mannosyl-glycoprotein beta-1,4-N-acetylglucosaminyltransferase
MFYYYLNLQKTNEDWVGTLASTFGKLFGKSYCRLRTEKKGPVIPSGGWHFTYQGGVDKIRQKINSWGEQSLNLPHVQRALEENVKNCISHGRDLFFRPAQFVVRDIEDGTFPKYLVDNREKFNHMIYNKDK